MTVSFSPANHAANPVVSTDRIASLSPANLLSFTCPHRNKKIDEILQSSFVGDAAVVPVPRRNGFVETVIQAYSMHHALIIRPDDVWLAILTQFSFFVNRNAESLRSQFVQHEGKEKLVVDAVGSRYTVDFGHMARTMTSLMHGKISDPTLCDWILPNFSTTTVTDTTVAAILMMATMKSYFTYGLQLRCGIPSVTLEGEQSDWKALLHRLERLKSYGLQAIAWYHLLVPVISRFVAAFDDPDGNANIDFWQKVAHRESMGSGPLWLSGWITAFCAFSGEGEWLGNDLNQNIDPSIDLTCLSAQEFWSASVSTGGAPDLSQQPFLILDGTGYHTIDTKNIPNGYAEVEAELNDNGTLISTIFTAGVVGSGITTTVNSKLPNDTLRPIAGWWMFIPKDTSAPSS